MFALNECPRGALQAADAGAGQWRPGRATVNNSEVGVFTPQQVANAIRQSFARWRGEWVYQHTTRYLRVAPMKLLEGERPAAEDSGLLPQLLEVVGGPLGGR